MCGGWASREAGRVVVGRLPSAARPTDRPTEGRSDGTRHRVDSRYSFITGRDQTCPHRPAGVAGVPLSHFRHPPSSSFISDSSSGGGSCIFFMHCFLLRRQSTKRFRARDVNCQTPGEQGLYETARPSSAVSRPVRKLMSKTRLLSELIFGIGFGLGSRVWSLS